MPFGVDEFFNGLFISILKIVFADGALIGNCDAEEKVSLTVFAFSGFKEAGKESSFIGDGYIQE